MSEFNCCKDCPCAKYPSEDGMRGQDLGCLPTKREILKAYDQVGSIWACHANEKRVCRGLVNLRSVNPDTTPTHGTTFGEDFFGKHEETNA